MKEFFHTYGRIMAWVIALLCFILPAVFLNSLPGYLPILVFLLLSLISLIYLLLLRRQLRWSDSGESMICERGDKMEFGISVNNDGLLVIPFLKAKLILHSSIGGLDGISEAILSLAPHEKRKLDMDVKFVHLGTYQVSVDTVQMKGLMGILPLNLPGGGIHRVEVLPHLWHIQKLPVSEQVHSEDSRAHMTSRLDGMDYTGVREYEQGDPIKNIHWKLSAHTSNYMTKQRETFGSTGLTIILDLLSEEDQGEVRMCEYDALIEGVFALGSYALEQGMESELIYFNKHSDHSRSVFHPQEDLRTLMSDLPGLVEKREDYPVEQLLERASQDLYIKNNVALVTASVKPETVQLLMRVRLQGRQPIVFFIMPGGLPQENRDERLAALKPLNSADIPWFAYSDPKELEGRSL